MPLKSSAVSLLSSLVIAVCSAGAIAAEPVDRVAAGRYLADAAHCAACHTQREDRPYAGNLAIPSSFGTLYSSNITSDPTTGIGRWTLEQFTAALRDGKGAHGEPLYPAMPYTEFTRVSDDDIASLYAYFKTVPPIVERTKGNAMKFPFNVRPGIVAWQALFFRKGRYVDDASQSAEWNRGAYLVQGLGHCGACHTPRNAALAYRKGESLEGAKTQDFWYAPDISGGRWSSIRDWSVEQVQAYLKTGHNDRNVAAVGPMLQTIAQGTAKLTDADLHAISVYLKNQPAPPRQAPRAAGDEFTAARRADGAAAYAAHCESCHGADGLGHDGVAPALAGNSALAGRGVDNVINAVLRGFAPANRWGGMPSFAHALDGQQIADVANYVVNGWGQTSPALATSSGVNRLRYDLEGSIDPKVAEALYCAPVPTGAMDVDTARQLGTLAGRGITEPPADLLARYRKLHPDVAADQAVNALTGTYCRGLLALPAVKAVDKQQRLIAFMGRVYAQGATRR